MQTAKHRYVSLDGIRLFYREAGSTANPTVLLLHGFPSSSIQFRYPLADLSDSWHLIAPDLPGFGFTTTGADGTYRFSFDNLANTIRRFIERLSLDVSALYLHDYGAHVGFRLLTAGSVRPRALMIQNSEAYKGVGWRDMMWGIEQRLNESPQQAREKLVQTLLNREGIRQEFLEALPSDLAELIDPAVIELGWTKLKQEGILEAMLDLHMDYASNLAHYPNVQAHLRQADYPVLLIWGERDQYLTVEAAQAYQQDIPGAQLCVLEGGHWILESHPRAVTGCIREFLSSRQRSFDNRPS